MLVVPGNLTQLLLQVSPSPSYALHFIIYVFIFSFGGCVAFLVSY